MKPIFVTGNSAKASRFSRLIGVDVETYSMELEEIQSTDLKKICEHKAKQAHDALRTPVIVEDVGLYFEALGSLPGPFIRFFVEEDDGLEKLCRMLDGFSNRRARTIVMTTYYDGVSFTHFEGGANGAIVDHPRGTGGFGYDSIWSVDGYDGKTRAEIGQSKDDESYVNARPIEQMVQFFRK